MSKKFDVVIGNPPYQEEAQGEGTRDTPVYHLFMDAAYEVGKKAVLITPARFLFNAGFTPKAWNEKMLADPHLTVPHYVPNSDELFPGTDHQGRHRRHLPRRGARRSSPSAPSRKYPELNTILHKVVESGTASIEPGITSSRSYRYTASLYDDHPEARALRPSRATQPWSARTPSSSSRSSTTTSRPTTATSTCGSSGVDQEQARVPLDSQRVRHRPGELRQVQGRRSRRRTVGVGNDLLGSRWRTRLSSSQQVAVTQTFITIGSFDTEAEAEACLKYVKSKFARAMLGVLKVTQHNPASTWKYVPAAGLHRASDIDWSKPIPEIDQQLYAKYGLDPEEIAFIEAKVKPME